MKHLAITAIFLAAATFALPAQNTLRYEARLTGQGSTGDFAPYMIGSWQGGRYTQKTAITLGAAAHIDVDTTRRFSWGAGVEGMVMGASAADYERFNATDDAWGVNRMGPNVARLQQLWAMVKWRGVYLLAGQKERSSGIVDGTLSSGDLVRSNNARPIPGVSAGFINFQNVPFTNGWVQIDGEIMYGKRTDSGWVTSQFNYFTGQIATEGYYHYKRCYFRSKPSMPFYVTAGMQAAGQWGGTTQYYKTGKLYRTDSRKFKIRDLWDMFFPWADRQEDFYKGNSLGSWDFRADYHFRSGHHLAAYFEWPWEDGSAIGRRNGWDGVWGLEFKMPGPGWFTAAVIELLDFTSQSGPMHWAPTDYPGTTITNEATGADNYFNNDYYGPYINFGMGLGTAFLKAPLYNLDGYPGFARTRSRGFHVAVKGNITNEIDYRAMLSAQWAWGNGRLPKPNCHRDGSIMVEATWHATRITPGLDMRLQLAADKGGLRGNNFGALVSLTYSGNFKFKNMSVH